MSDVCYGRVCFWFDQKMLSLNGPFKAGVGPLIFDPRGQMAHWHFPPKWTPSKGLRQTKPCEGVTARVRALGVYVRACTHARMHVRSPCMHGNTPKSYIAQIHLIHSVVCATSTDWNWAAQYSGWAYSPDTNTGRQEFIINPKTNRDVTVTRQTSWIWSSHENVPLQRFPASHAAPLTQNHRELMSAGHRPTPQRSPMALAFYLTRWSIN